LRRRFRTAILRVRRAPLPRIQVIAALFAAIMLVIAGAPVRAAAAPCNPCPPDCPMMQQAAAADHHDQAPAKGGADNPCKQGLPCQAVAAAPAPSQSAEIRILADAADVGRPARDLPAASHPPDRSLRPPIQL
jgi:hypothetical protein